MSDPKSMPELPPVFDVVAGPPDSKICPLMPPTIQVMPIMAKGGILAGSQGQQMAFTRHYVPCVKARCMFWSEADTDCLARYGYERKF